MVDYGTKRYGIGEVNVDYFATRDQVPPQPTLRKPTPSIDTPSHSDIMTEVVDAERQWNDRKKARGDERNNPVSERCNSDGARAASRASWGIS